MQVIPFTRRSITVKRFRMIGVPLLILATLTAVVALALTLFVPAVQAGAGGTEVFHGRVHPIRGAAPNAVTNSLMTYHGGPISSAPMVYINYWGSQWNTGFSTGGYTSAQAQTYINGFFGAVGGSSWGQIDVQYCQGVAVGTTNCGSSGTHVGNQTGLLGGTWVDTTSLPRRITQTSIANAATRLMNHFGYSANAIYFVFTPSGHSMSGFGTQWCAWHDNVNTSSGQMAYAYQPYSPNAGTSCGMNFVNGTNNSFGNGYFDGFSITAGHEWAEAETDMTPSTSVAWQGPGGGSDENADKCAWNNNGGVSTNISLGGHNYAVQPIWSNNSTTGTGSHCVTSHT
jgi:serine protease